MTPPSLPEDRAEKIVLLQSAVTIGTALHALLERGMPAARVRDFAAGHAGLHCAETATGMRICFGSHVFWEITIDGSDAVAGWSASGYGPLTDALGVDLSGRPHAPGNGN